MTALTAPQFTDETAAIAHLEASRWPDGPYCPHCGSVKVHRMAGKTQAGYFLCNDCRDKFTCRTGTVMERSHIPVHKWLLAIHLMTTGKNGVSAHELHRNLGITYKSAWFLSHRIREAMDTGKGAPMGGSGGVVQADETYYGNTSKRAKHYKKGHSQKSGVVALVDERTGEARAFAVNSDHRAALSEIERLWGANPGSEDADKLELLATLVEKYEETRWPIQSPNWDPVDVLQHAISEMGHSQTELASLLGSRSRASEILNRQRALTVEMIHKISEAWKIPATLLVKPYKILEAA